MRCRAAIAPCAGGPLSDYTGQLRARFLVRSTDRLNQLGHAITTQDMPLTAPIACVATPSSSAGSDCTAATSLDALVPGVVPEGKRSNWQLDQVTDLRRRQRRRSRHRGEHTVRPARDLHSVTA